MRVLVTGDRRWATEIDPTTGKRVQVENIEHHILWALLDGLGITALTEGKAAGADTVAHLWAEQNLDDHNCFPAKWEKFGRAAGPLRNQQMLDEAEHDLVIAVNRDWAKSKGTVDMVKRCEKLGLVVFRITSPLSDEDEEQMRLV